jgi:hypothetical protein
LVAPAVDQLRGDPHPVAGSRDRALDQHSTPSSSAMAGIGFF